MPSPSRPALRKAVFGQASSLAIAITLERLQAAELTVTLRLHSYVDRRKDNQALICSDLVMLLHTRLSGLYRPALVTSYRPYWKASQGRTNPMTLEALRNVRGWRKRYKNLLRRD